MFEDFLDYGGEYFNDYYGSGSFFVVLRREDTVSVEFAWV